MLLEFLSGRTSSVLFALQPMNGIAEANIQTVNICKDRGFGIIFWSFRSCAVLVIGCNNHVSPGVAKQ